MAGTSRLTGRFPRRSSRHYDECFNLAHAQQLKNKDIPEGGSKGVVLIDATAPGAGDAWGAQDAADFHDYLCRKSTKAYTDGVLDLCLPGDGEAQSLLPMVYLGPDEQIVPDRAGQESEIPNFKGSYLGRFPLVSADFWTSDHLSERSRSVAAFSGTRARGTLTLKRR